MITSTGFGHAGYYFTRSLQEIGYQVPYRDPEAPVEINWAHPTRWEWSAKGKYHIGYTPWESSGLKPGWKEPMKYVDELWTPSPLIARWFEEAVGRDVHVYQHGIDPEIWRARKRQPIDKVKFLHIGEPAPRKGGQLALDAFREAFGDSRDVSLTIKAYNYNTTKGPGGHHPHKHSNVDLNTRDVMDTELVDIVRNHDVLVYPGYGEGFGLIALQAIATGMPVICTSSWAPYKKFILPELRLRSTLGESPWPEMHPGKMFEPDYEQLVDLYRHVYNNFATLSDKAFKQTPSVVKAYDWKQLTSSAFDHISQRFG